MVTGNIKTTEYMFLGSGAKTQAQNKGQTDFANSMEKAGKNYDSTVTNTSKTGAREDVSENAARTEKTVSDQTQSKEVQSADKSGEAEVKETADAVKPETDDIVEAEDFTKAAENLISFQIPSEVDISTADETTQEIFEKISEALQVSVEDIQAAMKNLDLDAGELQNPQNVVKLIVELKHLKGPGELLTNSQLADTLKSINAEIKEIFSVKTQNVNDNASEKVSVSRQQIVFAKTEEPGAEMETMAEDNSANQNEHSENDNVQTQYMQNTSVSGSAVTHSAEGIYDKVQELIAERVDAETSENIVRQVVDQIKLNIKTDVTSMQMQLYPEHLGKVAIQVVSKNGVLTAQIAAESEAAKAALESQLNTLKENFDSQGLKVESVEVMVSTRGFEQNTDGNSGSEKNQKNGQKVRKSLLEELESLDEDDQEDDNLKETLGNTVSYTA